MIRGQEARPAGKQMAVLGAERPELQEQEGNREAAALAAAQERRDQRADPGARAAPQVEMLVLQALPGWLEGRREGLVVRSAGPAGR